MHALLRPRRSEKDTDLARLLGTALFYGIIEQRRQFRQVLDIQPVGIADHFKCWIYDSALFTGFPPGSSASIVRDPLYQL